MQETTIRTHLLLCKELDVNVRKEPVAASDSKLCVFAVQAENFYPYSEKLKTMLNEKECLKADNFFNREEELRFIAGRAVLRFLLARKTGRRGHEIEFEYGENLKPVIRKEKLHFNVSYSGDVIIVAISDREVGVDVEEIKDGFEPFLEERFNNSELEYIMKAANREEAFYTFYTRKEALLKGTGKVQDGMLRTIPVINGIHTVPVEHSGTRNDWQIISFKPFTNYQASVAFSYGTEQKAIRLIRFEPDMMIDFI